MSRRFDTNYHSPDVKLLSEQVVSSNAKRLGDLVAICYRYPTFYGFEYQASGVVVLKGENITRDGELIEAEEPSFVSTDIHHMYPKTQLDLNDLVMSVRGEVGKVGLVDQRFAGGNINANTIRISLKQDAAKNVALPRFVWAVLNSQIGARQVRRLVSGGVQETITAPEILDVLIPVPPLPVQKNMVAEMERARESRRRKLAEADALLSGLNAFFLDRLGLRLPKDEDAEPGKVICFAVKRGDLGKRIDCTYHEPSYRIIVKTLKEGPYPVVPFINIIPSKIGIRYGTGTPPPIVEKGPDSVPFVRATDIKGGEIQENDLLFVGKDQPPNMRKCLLNAGELIVVRSGVNTGDCAVVPPRLEASYAAYDLIIRLKGVVLPEFAALFLGTSLGRAQLNVRKGRAAQPHINAEEISTILLPLPPLPVQREMVKEMERRRLEARRLREEAAREWEKAKARFEARLLG